jgi:glycogen operon protein
VDTSLEEQAEPPGRRHEAGTGLTVPGRTLLLLRICRPPVPSAEPRFERSDSE